jgi:hypothetical protein
LNATNSGGAIKSYATRNKITREWCWYNAAISLLDEPSRNRGSKKIIMIRQIKISMALSLCLFAGFFNVIYGCNEKPVHHNEQAADENHGCTKYYDTALRTYIFENVDKMPEFKGGQEELLKFISTDFKSSSSQEEIQGKVCVSFIITADGKIANEKICNKSIENYTELDRNGIEFIKKTAGKWKPGKCEGLEVAVKYMLPIYIR